MNNRSLTLKPSFSMGSLLAILLMALAYYAAGLVGAQLQSAQTGITPFWPASGIAIAAFILYGTHLWPAIFLAMGAIALTLGIPLTAAMLSAAGSVIEAIIPLLVARHYGFTGSLHSIRQLLIFISISWFGPLLSASVGIGSFYLMMDSLPVSPIALFLVWWLGNSFGILLLGSAILLFHDCARNSSCQVIRNPWIIGIALSSLLISFGAFHQITSIQSPLLLTLLIPLVILSSIFSGFIGTILPVLIATTIMVILSINFPVESLAQQPYGFLYLDIVLLWIITLTGLLVSVAHQESLQHIKTRWQANHDGLTMLKNRQFLEAELEKLCLGHRQNDQEFCLLFIDLNKFKTVNDSIGHLAGDACLTHVANLLKRHTRTSDTVARWGGDEFILLLPNCPLATARQIADDINQDMQQNPFIHGDQQFNLSFSIGITCGNKDDTPEKIIDQADKASYQAKKSGEGIVLS